MRNGILLATGLAAATALAGADCAVNAFLSVKGDGVSIDNDGSIVCDRSATGSVTVSARPGWLVNDRELVLVDPKGGALLKVTSRLGEDEEHVHVFPQTTEDVHSEDIVLVAEATPASQIAMYALPDTSTVVSASATHKVEKRGKHKVTTTYYPCECGETHAPQESVSTYEVEPDYYEWTASGAGQTVKASTWTGQMSKGLRQSISFHVTGKRDECAACTCTASTNVFVDVHELSVTNGLYLGLDRTDCGRTNPVVKVTGAIIDPEPTGSSAYLWTDCGICSFTGRTDRAQVRYFAPDPDKGSAHHLAERLTVAATVTNECGSTASATCTTNFTVVAVDVTTDFSIGDRVVAFWAGGSVPNVTVVGKTANMLTVSGLGVPVPKYGGFRIVGSNDVYTVDRRFLPNAYGSAPDGSDGGAFIEFKLLDSVRNPNARVPKYNQFPNLTELQHYADYWFDNRNQRSKNVIDLVIASLRYSNQGQRIFGSTLAGYSLSMVFKAAAINETQANDTAAHEIGHRFGLRKRNGGGFVHIDMSVSQTAHDSLDNCLMSYDRNRNDSSVEFCTNCLSGGSSPFATDSLRSTEDK